ncbi:MAG: cysteine--tRNA ligase [Candidatus Pacearchaeota archaeon]|jgi:cysteinyl-tRNA synthetase
MVLKIYNTLTRKKEIFKSIEKNLVKIYGCGPTVYWYQHIGNLYRYIWEDFLIRVLKYNNYKINHVINITDVGHLTSDADEGEDKMENAIKKEGKNSQDIAKFYFDIFDNDLKKLNFTEPDKWAKASEHIKEQIDLIKTLEKKGFTYKTSQAIYFNVSKFKNYGELTGQKLEEKEIGVRKDVIVDKEKKNPQDFALWFFTVGHFKNHTMRWDSPWGVGFPGWHIECSAMSMKYLGNHFDIHTGGQDHIPVHHTNEIAQSEGATGKKVVNYWMHIQWLIIDKGKMSKSLGNVYLLSDLEKKGFSPMDFRYFCLTGYYRKPLNFSLENLLSAKNSYERLKNICLNLKDNKKLNKKYLSEFEKAINNDLNFPRALQVAWKLIRDKKAIGKFQTIKKMDEIFGLDLFKKDELKIPKEVLELIKKRNQARKEKNWQIADGIREKIKSLGFLIEDSEKGEILKKEKEYKL